MKHYIVLVFTLLLSIQSYSQFVKVIDKETEVPLSLVSVVSENQKSVITNSSGIVNIESLSGSKTLTFSLIGYEMRIIPSDELQNVNFIIALEPKDYLLNQVVISAQRWSTESAQLPSKIISIMKAQVELQNPQTAADLLKTSGEVFIQKSQMGGGSPMIRGFAANRLLISVDGVRMNTAIFRGGNLQNIISLDPFAISNTEVLFGPGSVMYGSDAIGGVMSFFTQVPQFSDSVHLNTSGNADFRYSSANREKTGHFDINLGWEKFAMTTSISHFNYGDLEMGKYGSDDYLRPFYVERKDGIDSVFTNPDTRIQNPTDYSQTNFMQKFRYKPNNKMDLQYAFHYSISSDVPRYDRLVQMKDELPKYAEWSYGPQVWMMNVLSFDYLAESKLADNVNTKVAWQHFEESRINRKLNNDSRRIQTEKVEAISINVDYKKHIGTNDHINYGGEVLYNNVKSVGELEDISTGKITDGASRYPDADWASGAVYLTYNWQINNQFILNTGARYNYYFMTARFDTSYYNITTAVADIENNALVGNLGINYQPGNDWILTANLSSGYRAPNIDDIGKVFDSEPGAVVVPNADLNAEYIYNSEVGISKTFGKSLSMEAHIYYSYLDNAMVRRDFQINGLDSIMYDGEMSKVQAIQNAAHANIWGLSVGLEARLMKGLQFSSRFNYQKGEEEMSDGTISAARHAAPMFGLSRFTYTHKKWKMDLSVHYSGEISNENLAIEEQAKSYLYAKDENGLPYSPAWYTINYKVLYQLHDMVRLSAGIENITNQRYRTYSSGITAAGTNLIFALNFRF